MNRDEVAVMSAVRSPFGKFGGTLKDFTLPALGGTPMPRALPRWLIWLAAVILALVVGFGGIWLLDPGGVSVLANRARAIVVPPTATPTPTATPQPTATPTPTPQPTATSTPMPTATPSPEPTVTPQPTATNTPTPRR